MPSPISSSSAGRSTQAPVTLQNAAAANGNGASLALSAASMDVLITILGASTPVMTVAIEHSFDSGSTWSSAATRDLTATAATLLTSIAASTTIARLIYTVPPGATHVRAPVSSYVSGNVTVTAIERRVG